MFQIICDIVEIIENALVDNLNSTSTTKGLTANMGRVLNEKKPETYGYYANPIAVWLIILKNNTDFRSAYLSGEPGLTERINDISFNILDINPRFDEQYQVNTASINQYFSKITLDEAEFKKACL